MSSPKFIFSQHYGVVEVVGRTSNHLIIEPLQVTEVSDIIPSSILDSSITHNHQSAKKDMSLWSTKIPTKLLSLFSKSQLNLLLPF